jgi:hypothetical protein
MEWAILILAVLVVLQWLWNATLRGRVNACEWRVQLAESAVQEYRARVVAAEKVIVDATDQFGAPKVDCWMRGVALCGLYGER